MPVYNTTPFLQSLSEETQILIEKCNTDWQTKANIVMNAPPAENCWSACQCLAHLNSYGHYYLPAISKAIEHGFAKKWTPRETFTSGLLGNYFTKMMEPGKTGEIKKMKAPKGHTPAKILDAGEVLNEFVYQQKQFLVLLAKSASLDIGRVKVPISIAPFIKLKLGDTFNFLVAHNKRHVVQLEAALLKAEKLYQSEKLSERIF